MGLKELEGKYIIEKVNDGMGTVVLRVDYVGKSEIIKGCGIYVDQLEVTVMSGNHTGDRMIYGVDEHMMNDWEVEDKIYDDLNLAILSL